MKDIPIETVIVEKASDIQPPLEESVAEFLDGILSAARANFDNDHEIRPIFFTLKDNVITPCLIEELTPEIKPSLFKWMHRQIPGHDACIFVVETWFAKAMKSESEGRNWTGLLLPSERIDRREMVMIQLWTPDRTLAIVAEIERKPDRLGEWEKFNDSADHNAPEVSGQMVPGKGKS